MEKIKESRLLKLLSTLVVIRTMLPALFPKYAYLAQLLIVKIITALLFSFTVYFLIIEIKKNKKSHFLYSDDKKKHIRNWLIFFSSTIVTIFLVAFFYRSL